MAGGSASNEQFEAFVCARGRTMARSAFLLTGDMGRAEELVQDALLKVWPRWSRITAAGDPEAYVRRVIYTSYVSWWRRRRVGTVPLDQVNENDRPAHVDNDAAELRLDMLRALGTLPRQQRAVVVLRLFEDRSERETAEILGCSVGTVKSHTSRALTKLRALPELQALIPGGSA